MRPCTSPRWSRRPVHRPSAFLLVLGLLAACTATLVVLYAVLVWLTAVPSATASPDWQTQPVVLAALNADAAYTVTASDLLAYASPAPLLALPKAGNARMTPAMAIRVACSGKGAWCVPVMMAVGLKESGMNSLAIGDSGRSHGFTQVRVDLPGRPTPSQLRDPLFAARWTLRRLESFGFDTRMAPAPLVLQKWNGMAECGWKPGRCIGGTWAEYGLTVLSKAKSLHEKL